MADVPDSSFYEDMMSKYEEKPVVMLHDEDDGRDFLFEREVPADAMFPAGAEARIDIPLKRKMEHDGSDIQSGNQPLKDTTMGEKPKIHPQQQQQREPAAL